MHCVCIQLIFAEQCTEAGGHCYHVDHYACAECQCSLAGNQYVLLAARPYCTTCFHSVYADYCCACGRIIAAEQRHVVHANRKWHDSCFRCESCGLPLVGRSCLLVADGRVFCAGANCTNQRRDKLVPDDHPAGSHNAREPGKQQLVLRQTMNQQQQMSAERIQHISRQTPV